MKKEYILFYDSGIGGLLTLKQTIKKLPHEDFLYFADNKNCPYGNKSNGEIYALVKTNIRNIMTKYKIKMIVFACNTITACCVEKIREDVGVPIVGIEPAILPAFKHSKTKNILVIATASTVTQEKYKKLIERIDGKVFSMGFKNLAKEIEDWVLYKRCFDKNNLKQKIKTFIKEKNVDAIVLGCTHYSYLKDFLLEELKVLVFDGNEGVAKRVESLVKSKNQAIKKSHCGCVRLLLSSRSFMKHCRYKRLLG